MLQGVRYSLYQGIGFAWFLSAVYMLNTSATVNLLVLNISRFPCSVYVSFVGLLLV